MQVRVPYIRNLKQCEHNHRVQLDVRLGKQHERDRNEERSSHQEGDRVANHSVLLGLQSGVECPNFRLYLCLVKFCSIDQADCEEEERAEAEQGEDGARYRYLKRRCCFLFVGLSFHLQAIVHDDCASCDL